MQVTNLDQFRQSEICGLKDIRELKQTIKFDSVIGVTNDAIYSRNKKHLESFLADLKAECLECALNIGYGVKETNEFFSEIKIKKA